MLQVLGLDSSQAMALLSAESRLEEKETPVALLGGISSLS